MGENTHVGAAGHVFWEATLAFRSKQLGIGADDDGVRASDDLVDSAGRPLPA